MKRVPGVGDLNVFGADYAMRLWINPDKLAELGLTVADVIAAVEEQNVQAPAGTIGQMPAPADQEFQYTGKIQGRLVTPEEFGNIIIRSDNNAGSFVRVKDVARIETGARTNNIIAAHNNRNSVGFGVQLTNDANAVETVAGVRQVLEEAAPDFPPDLEYEVVIDSTDYINESINEVMHTFVEALLLVMLIVYIFLQSWRATLIPMLAVPVSLIGTFAAFIVLDFSINTLTLFGMVLAIGLVVDDAIVVIENVERHMRKTDSIRKKRQAAPWTKFKVQLSPSLLYWLRIRTGSRPQRHDGCALSSVRTHYCHIHGSFRVRCAYTYAGALCYAFKTAYGDGKYDE